MQDIESIRNRLDNIESVEPIITSLRTIAAGAWQQALGRMRSGGRYVDGLREVMTSLLPYVSRSALRRHRIVERLETPGRTLVLVIASERRLCGGFNHSVLTGAGQLLQRQQVQSERVLVATLGAYARDWFVREGLEPVLSYSLPLTQVASLALVRRVAESLRTYLETDQVDQIQVIHSPYRAGVTLPPIIERWLPIEADDLPGGTGGRSAPIIETDPDLLFERVATEWVYGRFYSYVMESASSEQAARFRAMEAASDNIAEMLQELTQQYHVARQHAITMEMLDLVSGSGLLGGPWGEEE